MKTDTQRINNIIGQLEGIKRMVEADKPCFDVLTQIKATKSAFNAFSSGYLADKLVDCIDECKAEETREVCSTFLSQIIKES